MQALQNAEKFCHACESAQGWAGCRDYVADDASFYSPGSNYDDIKSVDAYCEQVAGITKTVFAGSTYKLHNSAYDADNRKAFLHVTSYAKHTGEGGPVPPTQKVAEIEVVYVATMNSEDKISHLIKVYDENSARKQLGWSES